MQYLSGTLLHKKQIKTHKGTMLNVVSILDAGEKFSQVVDVTDFDGHLVSQEINVDVTIPIRSRAGVSERGNAYINYVAAGAPIKHIGQVA